MTAGVKDALRLGCAAIGFTIYPGSEYAFAQMEELRELTAEAKDAGLAVVVWSYPRGPNLDKAGRDRARYLRLCRADGGAAGRQHHQGEAADRGDQPGSGEEELREDRRLDAWRSASRTSCSASFDGKRIVVFSGGEAKDLDGVYDEVRGLRDGGANGSIIGRNTFQRPKEEALEMLDKIIDIYQGKA